MKYYFHEYGEVGVRLNIKDVENIEWNSTDRFGSCFRFGAKQFTTKPIGFWFALRDYCTTRINEKLIQKPK